MAHRTTGVGRAESTDVTVRPVPRYVAVGPHQYGGGRPRRCERIQEVRVGKEDHGDSRPHGVPGTRATQVKPRGARR